MLNELDDCLILAHSEELVIQHQDLVLGHHLPRLGLRLKSLEKSFVSEATDNICSCMIAGISSEQDKRSTNLWVLWQHLWGYYSVPLDLLHFNGE